MAPVAFTTAFGIALLSLLAGVENPGSTTLISPLSASAALTLALNGAGLPSKTHAQLLKALTQQDLPDAKAGEAALNGELARMMATLPSNSSSSSSAAAGARGKKGAPDSVVVANALWTREGVAVRKAYADSMASMFQAAVREAKSAADVNAWVKATTQGLIPELLSPDTEFDVILANAMYFKGTWNTQFDSQDTQPREFTTHKNEKKEVDTMWHEFGAGEVLYASVPGQYKAVRLPYRSGNFSAVAVLPDSPSGKPEALIKLLGPTAGAAGAAAAPGLLAPLIGGARAAARGGVEGPAPAAAASGAWAPAERLAVGLPRFKLRASMSMSKPLQGLGVVDAFDESRADFSRASAVKGQGFYISDVVQEVVVNVDEEGTEAAAATGVVMLATSAPLVVEPPPEIIFNRPFLFALVHDDTGAPLVLAVVRDPPPAPAKAAAAGAGRGMVGPFAGRGGAAPSGVEAAPAAVSTKPGSVTSQPAAVTSGPTPVSSGPPGVASMPAAVSTKPGGVVSTPAGVTSGLTAVTLGPPGVTSMPAAVTSGPAPSADSLSRRALRP
ncbi:hypothetical protein Rsub_09257 [Raphidocelis subcapitata]|uniref:Serpin domain-containing protein n=1 Tax=Raphidocelis subcapitata TaxID=307507 RepID=A0A2V0P9C3_9CHLO|nr:hypothetical protein Rsub_09257 [Raphidocelis subcapitata]|eukprot:GBF96458.1 hypothetical protein Rsub_09257 [Raphidocelis subcapitata]